MGKKKNSRSKFAEAIDPRFTGIFKSSSNDLNTTKSSQEGRVFQKEVISDGDKGFRDFLSKQLFNYLESNIKVIDIPVEKLDLYKFDIEEVSLISGLPTLSQDSIEEKTEEKEKSDAPPKKKRKKEKKKEKECFKEVAVTADWLEKQAQLFNS